MTEQQILEKAIQKAIDGGWADGETWLNFTIWKAALPNVPSFIFNHDFAKALWGEGEIEENEHISIQDPWKIHLQQMVIADDPIAYLGENL